MCKPALKLVSEIEANDDSRLVLASANLHVIEGENNVIDHTNALPSSGGMRPRKACKIGRSNKCEKSELGSLSPT